MKNLTIIVHASAQESLADSLRTLAPVHGFTFTHVEGHSDYREDDQFLSARDKVVGYVPRIRVDVLLMDAADVSIVLAALQEKRNLQGQGVYWVSTVEQQGRL